MIKWLQLLTSFNFYNSFLICILKRQLYSVRNFPCSLIIVLKLSMNASFPSLTQKYLSHTYLLGLDPVRPFIKVPSMMCIYLYYGGKGKGWMEMGVRSTVTSSLQHLLSIEYRLLVFLSLLFCFAFLYIFFYFKISCVRAVSNLK